MQSSTREIIQWVEAIASSLAVFIAVLILLYFEVWKPRMQRPKLEIHYDNADLECRRFSPSGSTNEPSSYFIRLKIINSGKTPAERCIGRLVAIADENRNLRTDWDISSLMWTIQSKPEPIYLSPKGDRSFLDVAQIVEGEQVFRLRVEDTPRAIKLKYEPGQYHFQIVIYAEKADPVEQCFRVNWNGEFDKFTMEKTNKLSWI